MLNTCFSTFILIFIDSKKDLKRLWGDHILQRVKGKYMYVLWCHHSDKKMSVQQHPSLGQYDMSDHIMAQNHAPGPSSIAMPPTTTAPPSVIPSKRSDDDDVQFISSQPVKRRRVSDKKRQMECHPPQCHPPQCAPPGPPVSFPNMPPACGPVHMPEPFPNPMTFPMPMHMPMYDTSDTSEASPGSERRLSTGMVGLPSDMQAVELTYGIRGVSLPVLENFVFDQPRRGPRPPSSPELSPKQLPPQTISPAELSLHACGDPAADHSLHGSPNGGQAVHSMKESAAEPATIIRKEPGHSDNAQGSSTGQLHVLNTPVNQPASPASQTIKTSNPSHGKTSSMPPPPPPPPAPRSEPAQVHDSQQCHGAAAEQVTAKPTTQHKNVKQPCLVCARMRQQANNMARAPGMALMPQQQQHMPPHQLMPQMPCHQAAYGQHIPPHMMGMTPHGMHPFAPSFPMMMPVQGNGFTNLTPQVFVQPPQQPSASAPPPQSPQGVHPRANAPSGKPEGKAGSPMPNATPSGAATATQEKRSPKSGGKGTETSPTSSSTGTTNATTPAPVKPPASLIQPTYRKPSPNLIVDVAETCQERFPFEEVARRHNVPVEKVFDVFAAIIQVPLLRCPTDRRRAGKLATSRTREYARAKKDIQESRAAAVGNGAAAAAASGSSNTEGGIVTPITPLDIAQHMGAVNFPEGFNLGNGQA